MVSHKGFMRGLLLTFLIIGVCCVQTALDFRRYVDNECEPCANTPPILEYTLAATPTPHPWYGLARRGNLDANVCQIRTEGHLCHVYVGKQVKVKYRETFVECTVVGCWSKTDRWGRACPADCVASCGPYCIDCSACTVWMEGGWSLPVVVKMAHNVWDQLGGGNEQFIEVYYWLPTGEAPPGPTPTPTPVQLKDLCETCIRSDECKSGLTCVYCSGMGKICLDENFINSSCQECNRRTGEEDE